MFAVISQFGISQISCTGISLTFPGQEDIIFVGVHILLSQLVDIVKIFQTDRINRKFFTVFLLVIE